MDEDPVQKFVDNMRAAGQPDDMIADNLFRAGHNHLIVLNALGVSDIEELHEGEAKPVAEEPTEEFHIPSAYQVTDAEGNMLISPDNMPMAIGETEQPKPKPKPAAKPLVRTHPRAHRAYPRPTARRISDMPSKPKTPPVAKPVVAAKVPTHKLPQPLTKPTPPAAPPEAKKPAAKNKIEPSKKYGHHTFDDFMGRIKGRKELEAGEEHNLEVGNEHTLEPGYEQNTPVEVMETAATKPEQAESQGPGSIDELLEAQLEEVKAGPGGPDMSDLLDDKDVEALKKAPNPKSKQPKAVDLKKTEANEAHAQQIQGAAQNIEEIRSSNLLKTVVILIGVLVLVGLAASVATRITG